MSSYLPRAPAEFDAVDFARLPGVSWDRLSDCWRPFTRSCERILCNAAVLRIASSPPGGMLAAAERALRVRTPTEAEIRAYFSEFFSVYRIRPLEGLNPHAHGFVTGYFEPEALASSIAAPEFEEPVRGRPSDLENITIDESGAVYSAARRTASGQLIPYWSRAEIDAGKSGAPIILWLRDAVELFLIQVQGSARVLMPDRSAMRLVYDGRNGQPYESIGRILVGEGHIPLAQMSLDRLKSWVRTAGQEPGQPGRALLHRNPSYVFFRLVEDVDPDQGPTGGEGIPLTKLRSLAIDRSIWAYGLPFWINGRLPMEGDANQNVQRLMIAQDTGSAIIGAARGDIFYGSGDAAGQVAARVRHEVEMFVLLPKD